MSRFRRRIRAWLHTLLYGPFCLRCEARHAPWDRELCDVLVSDQERELFRIEQHHPGGLP
jgi:hypothetical protein